MRGSVLSFSAPSACRGRDRVKKLRTLVVVVGGMGVDAVVRIIEEGTRRELWVVVKTARSATLDAIVRTKLKCDVEIDDQILD